MKAKDLSNEDLATILRSICVTGICPSRDEKEYLQEAADRLEQESCDDVISREAVRKILAKYHLGESRIAEELNELPSVTQKSGHWIWSDEIDRYVCDKCGQSDGKDKEMVESGEYPLSNYCHNCGAKMVEPQERSEDAT